LNCNTAIAIWNSTEVAYSSSDHPAADMSNSAANVIEEAEGGAQH
jgi:hypothetical protein